MRNDDVEMVFWSIFILMICFFALLILFKKKNTLALYLKHFSVIFILALYRLALYSL